MSPLALARLNRLAAAAAVAAESRFVPFGDHSSRFFLYVACFSRRQHVVLLVIVADALIICDSCCVRARVPVLHSLPPTRRFSDCNGGAMDRLGSFANFLLTRRYQEDAIDRLHFQSTAIFLLAAAIAIFTKEYGGNAIQCWTTAEWQNSWIEYAQDYCFISSTYHVPRSQPLGQFDERYEKHEEIVYYQVGGGGGV